MLSLSKTTKKKIKKLSPWLLGLIFGFFIITGTIYYYANIKYKNVFLPNLYLNQIQITGLTKKQAINKIKSQNPTNFVIQFQYEDQQISYQATQAGIFINYQTTLDQAYNIGRDGNIFQKIQTILKLKKEPIHYKTEYEIDLSQIKPLLLEFKKTIDIPAKQPKILLTTSQVPSSLTFSNGENGQELLVENTIDYLTDYINSRSITANQTITITPLVKKINKKLTNAEISVALESAKKYVNKQIFFNYEQANINFTLNDQQLVNLLIPGNGYNHIEIQKIIKEWEQTINREPLNAQFEYDPQTLQVYKFIPHQLGLELNYETTKKQIIDGLNAIQNNSLENNQLSNQINVHSTQPDIVLQETNNLGIKEIIGFGESYYHHSIPNRIYNVNHAANKISGTIVRPGEEFSFNQSIGEVTTATGFKNAYVIRNNSTELAAGGGVCQVSTTVFRALLDAGVKITLRKPHSYRVSYYEIGNNPGYDATVYSGSTDLRFINDTNHHLLIYAQANSEDLYMKVEIYGTSDGRSTEIVDYKKWGYTPPPPPVYIPDPNLAPGQTKLIDRAKSGISSEFTNVIKNKNGEIIRKDTYYSYYRAWPAKYLQGI